MYPLTWFAALQNTASPPSRHATAERPRLVAAREFWANFSRNRGAVVAGVIVLVLIFIAIFAPLIAPHSPIEQYRDYVKIPPAWLEGGNWKFLLGTDEAGRDILSRLMYGARLSFWIGFVSVVLALIPGVVLGLIAAFFENGPTRRSCASWTCCSRCRRCCSRWRWSRSSVRDSSIRCSRSRSSRCRVMCV